MSDPAATRPGGADPEQPVAASYTAASAELREILAALQRGDVDVDELGALVERGYQLVTFCRSTLHAVSVQVHAIVDDHADAPADHDGGRAGSGG